MSRPSSRPRNLPARASTLALLAATALILGACREKPQPPPAPQVTVAPVVGLGPPFVATIVYVTLVPGATAPPPSVIVIPRSAAMHIGGCAFAANVAT